MRITPALVLVSLTLGVSPLVTATHLTGCTPSTTVPTLTVPAGAATLYIDDGNGGLGEVWVVLESNGETGLQYADNQLVFGPGGGYGAPSDNTCGHPENADTILF